MTPPLASRFLKLANGNRCGARIISRSLRIRLTYLALRGSQIQREAKFWAPLRWMNSRGRSTGSNFSVGFRVPLMCRWKGVSGWVDGESLDETLENVGRVFSLAVPSMYVKPSVPTTTPLLLGPVKNADITPQHSRGIIAALPMANLRITQKKSTFSSEGSGTLWEWKESFYIHYIFYIQSDVSWRELESSVVASFEVCVY